MHYLGIDIHSAYLQVALLDADGVVHDYRVEQDSLQTLQDLLKDLAASTVAMEACCGAYRIYDLVAPLASRVLMADPREFRRCFPKAGKKTDRQDARNLALFASYQAKGIWVPDEKVRQARLVAGERVSLSELRTRAKNSVHSRLREHGVRIPKGGSRTLWSEEGLRWLRTVLPSLPQAVAASIDVHLGLLEAYDGAIETLDRQIAELSRTDPEVQLIMSIPGVDYYSAFVIKAELGDHRRFSSAKQVASYAGLVPRVHQSGKYCVTGRITRRGRSTLRWMAVECGLSSYRHCPKLKSLHDRVKRRSRIAGKAKVAVGRRLLELVWHVLQSGEPYRAGDPDLHQRKIRRLGRRAMAYTQEAR
jgi:transposase